MDFYGMKRKKLQSLCKKHGIPANLKNKEMADRLSFIFKGKEKEDPLSSQLGSDNSGTKKVNKFHCVSGKGLSNVETIDLVSPSPGLEKTTGFFDKVLKSSEIESLEFETNLSPEVTREDFGICDAEKSIKCGLNEEQISDSQKSLHSAPDVAALEEFSNHLEEGEVQKLGDKTNHFEDICGTGEAEAEGSNRNDLNILLVSPEESGYPLVEGEVHKPDEYTCDRDAFYNVGNGRYEVDTSCLDTSTDAMDADVKTNVTVEHFIDEVHSSSEMKSTSSEVNIHEMVVSGTGTINSDTCEARFVSSQKISLSPASERVVGFSPKLLNNSETKVLQPEANFSPATLTVDNEICEVEKNIQIDVNKEQVDESQKVVIAMNNEDIVQVPSEEVGNHLVEGKVEKLSNKNNLFEEACENGKGRDEAVEQGDHNSPQSSNMNDVNLSHVSQEEPGYSLVEEVQKCDDNTYNCGVFNLGNSGSEVDAKDTDGKTNLTIEHFADSVPNNSSCSFKYSYGTPDQFLTTYPLSEVKSSDPNIHQDNCQEKLISQKTSPIADSDECIEFSPNYLEASFNKDVQDETYFDISTLGDVGTCNNEKNMQIDKMEEEYSQEVSHTTNNAVLMNNVDHLQRSIEECNSVQGEEITRLFDNSDVHDSAAGNGAEDDTNSPQGSNRNDLNLLIVSHEDFGLVEGKFHKSDDYLCICDVVYNVENGRSDTMCLDTSIGAMDTDGKTNVTNFVDEVHSSALNNSDGTPVQFLPTYASSEAKFSYHNIPEMVVSGTATRNEDSSEAKFVSSRKISLSSGSERMVGFSLQLLDNSGTKVLESEMNYPPESSRVDIGIYHVEESMQIGVNNEQVHDSQEVMHAASSSIMVINDENLVQVASEEFDNHLVGGEVEKLGEKNNLEDVCENGEDRDESVKQGDHNSPQGLNIYDENLVHVSQEDPLVEEVWKFDDNIFHGGVYNVQNSGSEVDAMSLLDKTIAAKDADGKINVTIEHFPVDVPSSSFKYSAGTPDKFLTAFPPSEAKSSGHCTHQMVALDTGDEKLKSSQKTGLVANPEEYIEFSPNNLEPSVVNGFQADKYFGPTTLGDVVASCNMKESKQSDQMEKEHSQEVFLIAKNMDFWQGSMEECNLEQAEVTSLFDNSDVHDDAGGTGAEDENQHHIHMDMDSLEKYLLSELKSVDEASGPNSDGKPDELVPTMPQPSEMKSCTFDLPQISASDTASPPKCTPIASSQNNISFDSKLLESSMMKEELKIEINLPLKHARDVLGASDMKENVKIAKKEQSGSIITKNTFSKRQPLKNLQQN